MTPSRRKWGVYLCACTVPDGFGPERLADLEVVVTRAAGAASLPDFAAQLRQAYAEAVLFVCTCTEPEVLAAACEAVGLAPAIHPLQLRTRTEAEHAPQPALDKTRRLIAGAVRGLDARPAVTENVLAVGGRMALFADRPEGLQLAQRLQEQGSLVVFLDGDPEQFGAVRAGINRGRPEAVTGRLGALEVQVAPVAGSDFSVPQRIAADQVLVLGAAAAGTAHRTGVHRIPAPTPAALEQAFADVSELMGTFGKPEHVAYDLGICAGGAADRPVCGHCIPACPYDAVSRDPGNSLRIRVDHLTCEGCGACASACPTSALRFTDPAPDELYGRLAAMLAPRPGDGAQGAPAVVFHCEQQGQAVLDWAAEQPGARLGNLLPVAVPCLRYVSDAAMLAAVRLGAAGVALLGCETCPNGERELLLQKMELAHTVLDAFELGAQRLRLITAREDDRPETLTALHTFAGQVGAGQPGAAPVPADGKRLRATGNRDVLAEVIGAFIDHTGKEVGGLRLGAEQPFGLVTVRDEGCTLCRACATVCPTHAFAFDLDAQALRFKHISCIHCGLCEAVCPERVVTLSRELYPAREALQYVTVAEDEMIHCHRCEKPYINRRALETVQARLRAVAFEGSRVDLLSMCPDCRGVAAMMDVNEGWRP